MVRLKQINKQSYYEVNIKSQFHYGSIKTKLLLLDKQQQFSLNSTMVRLKLYFTGNLHIDSRSQFHYGSIKTKI